MQQNLINKHNVRIIGNERAARTIIFAHGFGTDQTAWKAVAAAFAAEYKIILYDNAGAGNTDLNTFDADKYRKLYCYSDDLVAICEALDIHDAILVGHSVSGMIGMQAAIKAPHRFHQLVFISASPRYLNDEGYVGGFEQSDLDVLYEAMNNNYFAWVSGFAAMVMNNDDRPQLAAGFAQTLSALRPDIAQSVARTIFQSDCRAELPRLEQDTLIMQTSHDVAVPMEVAEYLHKHIKNSKLVVVNATGHFPHISAPEQIITAIRNFIG